MSTKRRLLCLLALLASGNILADDEITIIEQWPTCTFEKLGTVSATDGKRVGPGSVGSRRASVERAEGRIIKEARKLGAERIVLIQRNIQRDGNTVRYVELKGTAIGPCAD